MKIFPLFFLLLINSLLAQDLLPTVKDTVPQILFLEAGGKQVNTILRGENLQGLQKIQVTKQGRPVRAIFTQLGPPEQNRRGITFIASEQSTLGTFYTLQGLTKEGSIVTIPMSLTIVPLGDSRATLSDTATLAEVTRVQNSSRVVVSETLAPVVTSTQPNPLILAPNKDKQTIILQGRNLEGITEVRVRKANKKPLYRGNQGLLPSRITERGLEVDVIVGTGTAMGSTFTLDLMVKKFLADSISLSVGIPVVATVQEVFTAPLPSAANPVEVTVEEVQTPKEIVIPLKRKTNNTP
ncbi:MAG: hypothetical protein SH807_09930 [Blastochloris sp.]|nr:hypothetical protein [Blastochloris sp.]